MNIRIGNACWHAGQIHVAAYCQGLKLFDQESARCQCRARQHLHQGDRFDAARGSATTGGTVLRDMIAFSIDIPATTAHAVCGAGL